MLNPIWLLSIAILLYEKVNLATEAILTIGISEFFSCDFIIIQLQTEHNFELMFLMCILFNSHTVCNNRKMSCISSGWFLNTKIFLLLKLCIKLFITFPAQTPLRPLPTRCFDL